MPDLPMPTLAPAAPRALAAEPQASAALHHRNVLDLDDFSAEEIELVLDQTLAMKEVLARPMPRVPTLRGKTLMNLFYENSTRTRASFEVAGKALGADVVNMTADASSVKKGESLVDTARTLQALGADYLVVRHPQAGAPYLIARHTTCRVLNAGDGWHAHPSQALLDLFTIRERLGRLSGLRVAIVGDILHSRVARSNIWGLSCMGAEVVLCAPPTLLPQLADGSSAGELPPCRVEHNLDRALAGADVVMALRLQLERQQRGLFPSIREYAAMFQISAERLKCARPGALVMHPGPMNEGVEISAEVAHGAQSVVEHQVTNGVAVRMALLYLLSGSNA